MSKRTIFSVIGDFVILSWNDNTSLPPWVYKLYLKNIFFRSIIWFVRLVLTGIMYILMSVLVIMAGFLLIMLPFYLFDKGTSLFPNIDFGYTLFKIVQVFLIFGIISVLYRFSKSYYLERCDSIFQNKIGLSLLILIIAIGTGFFSFCFSYIVFTLLNSIENSNTENYKTEHSIIMFFILVIPLILGVIVSYANIKQEEKNRKKKD